jgi:LysM repeat protein
MASTNRLSIFPMNKIFRALLTCLVLFSLLVMDIPQAHAQVGNGYDLVAAVNALRAANGLAPYSINSTLMNSAQGHSQYQASIGKWTHYGADGSDETDRAIAAGYGARGSVLCDEAVAMGSNLSPQGAVDMWQDPVHLAILLSPNFVDAGGGSAVSGGFVYYTLDACYGGSGNSLPAPTVQPGTPLPTSLPIYPVTISTPRPDGSIIHVVMSGQTLSSISTAYGVSIATILAYNGLNENSVIFPGDLLLIQLPGTPNGTPQESATLTQTPAVSATRSPTPRRSTPTITPTLPDQVAQVISTTDLNTARQTVTNVPGVGGMAIPRKDSDVLLIMIFVLGVLGSSLVILGNALKHKA